MSLFPAINFGLQGYGGYGFGAFQIAQLPPADLPPAGAEEKAEPIDPIDHSNYGIGGYWGAVGRGWFPGFDKAPPPGIPTWWLMRYYGTVVLAMTVVTGPILGGKQTIETVQKDDTEADGWKDKAEMDLIPPLLDILSGALECLPFGAFLHEMNWVRRNGRLVPEFTPLLPGEAILYRGTNRQFVGYKVQQEERDARYGFLAVNDRHMDPIFGVSRNFGCREDWWRARESEKNADRVENKASGIQMMIGLPMGASFTDSKGNPIMGTDVGQAIVNAAAQGHTFQVPLTPFRKEDIVKNPALADIPAVKIQPFDWKDNAPALMAHLQRLTRLDKQIMRAWHRPEREAMEGQFGTKAESGVHGAIGTTDSELVAAMVLRQYTAQVVDRWAVTNFGPDAIGRLRGVQAPLSDPQQEFLQAYAKTLAQDTATGPDINLITDKRALLDRLEVPLLSEDDVNKAKVRRRRQKSSRRQGEGRRPGEPAAAGAATAGESAGPGQDCRQRQRARQDRGGRVVQPGAGAGEG